MNIGFNEDKKTFFIKIAEDFKAYCKVCSSTIDFNNIYYVCRKNDLFFCEECVFPNGSNYRTIKGEAQDFLGFCRTEEEHEHICIKQTFKDKKQEVLIDE